MTALREAAQQALEALVRASSYYDTYSEIAALEAALTEDALQRFTDVNQEIEAALAEPVRDTGVKLKPVFYAPRRLDDEEIEAIVGKPVQEPPCATRECMPSECPNCVSLQDQNTELDRKLADLEQTSLELCEVCGWRTLIPGDCCLNCERKHPLGQASTDVPLTVYSVKKAEPVQETCTYKCEAWPECGCASPKAEPVERKPMNEFDALRLVTETVGFLKSAGPVEGLIGIIRAVERAHGIT